MPSTPLDSMLAATLDKRRKDIMDQAFDANPATAYLRNKGKITPWEGGENIEVIISIAKNNTVGARDYKTPVPLREQDPLRTVSIGSRIINGSLVIYEAQRETNVGKQQVVNLVTTLLDNAKESLADALALEMWQDGSGEHLHGLGAIFSRTNTYMGIDRTGTGYAGTGISNNWWWPKMGQQYTHALNGFTFGPFDTAETLQIEGGTDGGIRALYNACCLNGGTGGPDLAIMPEHLWNELARLIGGERLRYNEQMAQIGYPENIMYRKCTFVWDRNCNDTNITGGSSSVFMINTDFVEIMPLSAYANGPRITEPQPMTTEGLDATVRLLVWRGNLICTAPSRCGVLSNKTVA